MLNLSSTAQPEKVYWLNGKQVCAETFNGIRVTSSFEQAYRGEIVFRITVLNESDSVIVVDPAGFELIILDTILHKEYRFPIKNPEQLIGLTAERLAQNARSQQSNSVWSLAETVTSLSISTVALFKKETPEEVEKRRKQTEEQEEYRQKHTQNLKNEEQELTAKYGYYAQVLFRKNTLNPNEQAEGLIIFPQRKLGQRYVLRLAIDQIYFSFGFEGK